MFKAIIAIWAVIIIPILLTILSEVAAAETRNRQLEEINAQLEAEGADYRYVYE